MVSPRVLFPPWVSCWVSCLRSWNGEGEGRSVCALAVGQQLQSRARRSDASGRGPRLVRVRRLHLRAMVAWSQVTSECATQRGCRGGTAAVGHVKRGATLLAFPAAMLMDRYAAERNPVLAPLLAEEALRQHDTGPCEPAAKTPKVGRCSEGVVTNEEGFERGKRPVRGLPDSWVIILMLVHERCKGDSSFWAPYIRLLPEDFDNALHFTPAQAALLAGTRLGDELLPAARSDLARLGTVLERLSSRAPSAFPPKDCTEHTLSFPSAQ